MDHYAAWRSDGAADFRQKYDETIAWISWNCDSFPQKYGEISRAIIKRSYYIVYFITEEDRNLVLAVLDGRRNPAEIRRILKTRAKK
jgi:plasmid stabilization system protein ParE